MVLQNKHKKAASARYHQRNPTAPSPSFPTQGSAGSAIFPPLAPLTPGTLTTASPVENCDTLPLWEAKGRHIQTPADPENDRIDFGQRAVICNADRYGHADSQCVDEVNDSDSSSDEGRREDLIAFLAKQRASFIDSNLDVSSLEATQTADQVDHSFDQLLKDRRRHGGSRELDCHPFGPADVHASTEKMQKDAERTKVARSRVRLDRFHGGRRDHEGSNLFKTDHIGTTQLDDDILEGMLSEEPAEASSDNGSQHFEDWRQRRTQRGDMNQIVAEGIKLDHFLKP
ncbi:hypothetical protein T439DRAFT_382886 [Meredithblackwellia eburnea MCA 4105]